MNICGQNVQAQRGSMSEAHKPWLVLASAFLKAYHHNIFWYWGEAVPRLCPVCFPLVVMTGCSAHKCWSCQLIAVYVLKRWCEIAETWTVIWLDAPAREHEVVYKLWAVWWWSHPIAVHDVAVYFIGVKTYFIKKKKNDHEISTCICLRWKVGQR